MKKYLMHFLIIIILVLGSICLLERENSIYHKRAFEKLLGDYNKVIEKCYE